MSESEPESVFYSCPLPGCPFSYEALPNISPAQLEAVLTEHSETHSAAEFMAFVHLLTQRLADVSEELFRVKELLKVSAGHPESRLDAAKGSLLPPAYKEAEARGEIKLVGRRLPRPPS